MTEKGADRQKVIVPDASAILKWALGGDEPERESALRILNGWLEGKYEIILPSLWIFEVGNILSRREPELAKKILCELLDLRFAVAEIDERLLATILSIVRDKKVTFYDASYHAIAILNNGTFVTADRSYFNRVKEKGFIRLLSDLD
ncbi:MAG: type II toxin-antitoxin system VapC family toxin [Deltaproteobacteria bacterium]|nr:type II toxin-antitoxin system VapC family toxin [Deltaproteobacteria bacterium]